jgi:hypothetical protein
MDKRRVAQAVATQLGHPAVVPTAGESAESPE